MRHALSGGAKGGQRDTAGAYMVGFHLRVAFSMLQVDNACTSGALTSCIMDC